MSYARGSHTGDPERDLAYEREGRNALAEVEMPPDEVIQYLLYFKRMLEEENVAEIQGLYEHGFTDLTERFFTEKPWPDERVVEKVVGTDNRMFIVLYKELYFRDLYTRASRGPSLGHRYDSYMNYQELFSMILNQANNHPIQLQLPNLWLWDIIDELVYQFQSFCLYKANPSKRSAEENDDLMEIEETQNAWNIYPVLNILYSLLDKSQINEQLKAIREGNNPDDVTDEFGRNALYFKLGYFSLIGLLRTQVLLGDYHQALKTVESLEMDPKGLYNTVPSALVTLHYFVGFSHLMLRNYGEATKLFVNCLLYTQRTHHLPLPHSNQQQQKKGNSHAATKYDVIGKTKEQIFHLLTICLTLQPQRIDEAVQSQLHEKLGDRMMRMANGDIEEFRTAFLQGCPKFLSPTTVAYDGINLAKEPLTRQCNAFLEGIESQIALPVLRGYLKLYTSISLRKLTSFTKPKTAGSGQYSESDVSEQDIDAFVVKLLTFKMIVNELGKETLDRYEVTDDSSIDADFYVDLDMIHIADTQVARQIGGYFIRSISKLREITRAIKASTNTNTNKTMK